MTNLRTRVSKKNSRKPLFFESCKKKSALKKSVRNQEFKRKKSRTGSLRNKQKFSKKKIIQLGGKIKNMGPKLEENYRQEFGDGQDGAVEKYDREMRRVSLSDEYNGYNKDNNDNFDNKFVMLLIPPSARDTLFSSSGEIYEFTIQCVTVNEERKIVLFSRKKSGDCFQKKIINNFDQVPLILGIKITDESVEEEKRLKEVIFNYLKEKFHDHYDIPEFAQRLYNEQKVEYVSGYLFKDESGDPITNIPKKRIEELCNEFNLDKLKEQFNTAEEINSNFTD